jgi:hypothetical protein
MVAYQANRLNDQFREAMERPADLVKEYPLPSMLLMFGVGIGVGVILSQTVCSSLLEMAEAEPSMADKVRKQVYEALSHVISPATLRQVQNFTS